MSKRADRMCNTDENKKESRQRETQEVSASTTAIQVKHTIASVLKAGFTVKHSGKMTVSTENKPFFCMYVKQALNRKKHYHNFACFHNHHHLSVCVHETMSRRASDSLTESTQNSLHQRTDFESRDTHTFENC